MRTCGETKAVGGWNARLVTFDGLRRVVAGNPYWDSYLEELWDGRRHAFSVHLAVFVEPYLGYMLEGRKTIESRFSVVRCAPYDRVQPGDVLLLKRSGGPVVGVCRVARAWFYRLDPHSWHTIRREFTDALCAQDPEFWRMRQRASFATLMQVDHLCRIGPLPWAKRDRRGWVVLRARRGTSLFEDLTKHTVFAFAGGIGSGKTTVSAAVADALHAPRVSFGEYVRKITRNRGLEDSRGNWQSVGESLVRKNVRRFCASVLAQATWEPGQPLVVDGVRHVRVVQALKALVAPSQLRLIYLDMESTIRERRLRERTPTERTLEDLERHSTEVEVKTTLRQMADLVVNASRTPDELAREIITWAEGR